MGVPPVTTKQLNEILAHFERTADQFFSKDEFKARLKSGQKLRIKYGVDVTAPTLHIGHAVNLWLMRYLQDRGHKVIFLIGDFTTAIGDPDGKMDTRPVIPQEDIERNAKEFIEQAKMVLRFDDPELLEIRRNSEWLDRLSLRNFLELASQVTHAKLISRDMFQKRIEQKREIHIHEMLYPMLQGWDSVEMQADLTIIGSDQLFNEMMGRTFQEKNRQKPQTIITTKITPGIDGKQKQSKSLGNFVGLAHSPRDKFGRVMSIPDELIEQWFIIYTDLSMSDINDLRPLIKSKPRNAKIRLAAAIVERYHGLEVAAAEMEWFEDTISRGNVPEDIPTLSLITDRMECFDLVKLTRPEKSKSDTRRLIQQGGVELNGEKIEKPDEELLLKTNDILKVGKRNWFRIEIVGVNNIETEKLWMKPLVIEDIDLIRKYIPAWDIVRYLSRLQAAGATPKKEVFKKVITQPEPKTQWLWKIAEKKAPDAVIGVAHLAREGEGGSQNVWLAPAFQDAGLVHEAMVALNEHAFNNLGFNTMIIKDAFAHAVRDVEDLRSHFAKHEPAIQPTAQGLSVTRQAWQQTHPPVALPPAPVLDWMQEEEMMRVANPYNPLLPERAFVAPPPPPVTPPPAAPPVTPPVAAPPPVTPTALPFPPSQPATPPAPPPQPPKLTPEEEAELERQLMGPQPPKPPMGK
ncbi:MAG: tyrosine--tRNA ligase [Alphaproteobacteria bacterium]